MTREEEIVLLMERWQKMTITSDPMFGMVMENREICLELINRALPNLRAKQIVQLSTQKDINVVSARRVRFEVYVRDEQNNIVVVEMQVNNNHNLPARLRYYQEQIDHSLLRPGDDYQVLNQYPTYIIMFCDFDYFGRGWARYEFNLACTRDPALKFGDQRTVVVFNALAEKFAKNDEPIRNFLALMRHRGDNKSKFITQIQDEIKKIKQDAERRQGFMKFELEMMDARRAGKEEGLREGEKRGKEQGIRNLVTSLRKVNAEDAVIKQELQELYQLSDEQVAQYLTH